MDIIPFCISIFSTLVVKLVLLNITLKANTHTSLVRIPWDLRHIFRNVRIDGSGLSFSFIFWLCPKPQTMLYLTYTGVLFAPVVSFSGIVSETKERKCRFFWECLGNGSKSMSLFSSRTCYLGTIVRTLERMLFGKLSNG